MLPFFIHPIAAQALSVTYHYNSTQQLSQVDYDGQLMQTLTYDARQRLQRQMYSHAGHTPVLTWQFAYDQMGRLVTRWRTTPTSQTQENYGYNAHQYLQQYHCQGQYCAHRMTFGFDAFANITWVKTPDGTTHYRYDPLAPMHLQNRVYDRNGNIIVDDQQHTYGYDPFNHLLVVKQGHVGYHYGYDGQGRQIALAVEGQPPCWLHYDQQRLLTLQCAHHVQHYVYGRAYLGRQRDQQAVQYPLTDQQQSVVAWQQAGQLSQQRVYAPYGVRQSASTSIQLDVEIGFQGQPTDPLTGWQFLGNGTRVYVPELRRFLSADRWSPFGTGGVNAYHFANNDPINNSDPSGHSVVSSLLNLTTLVALTVAGNVFGMPFVGNLIGSLVGQVIQNGLDAAQGESVPWLPEMAGALVSPLAMGVFAEGSEAIASGLFQGHTGAWMVTKMLGGALTIDGGAVAGEIVKNTLSHQPIKPDATLLAAGALVGLLAGGVDYSMVLRDHAIFPQQSSLLEQQYVSSLGKQEQNLFYALRQKGHDFILPESDVLDTAIAQDPIRFDRTLQVNPLYRYGLHHTLEYIGDDIFAIFARDDQQPQP